MATVVAAGALTGGSLWLVWTGWSPERAPLQTLLDGFGQTPVEVEPASGEVLDVRIGRVARKIGIIDRTVNNMRADLRVLHRSPEEQAAQLVTSTLLGWLFIPVVSSFSLLAGGRIPLAIPFWTSILGAVTGAVWAVKSVKPEAIERRRAFSQALAAFCDVCGMSLASGQGVGSSLEAAATAGSDWPFIELQTALRTGYVRGETPWDALTRLGNDADLPDLCELAAALALAGDQGAQVRSTVGSKAKTIRERLTSEVERNAASTTERMGIPTTFLMFGFVIFIGYPALAQLL